MISYAHKLKDSLTWWLGRSRPFIINDQYAIELLFIDKINNSAKIKVTNLTNGLTTENSVSCSDFSEANYGTDK
jgi:hypothetical protein